MAQLKLRIEIIEFAPLLLPRFGLRLRAQENELLIAPFAPSFSSGKSNGVVAANVMRHRRQPVGRYVCLGGVFWGMKSIGEVAGEEESTTAADSEG
jgi:hypothetical protein